VSLSERSLELHLRDRARFGRGCAAGLPDLVREIGASRAFLVTDAGVSGAGVAAVVEAVLVDAGLPVAAFSGVEADPGPATCAIGAEALRAFGTEGCAVVALGGGSVIDSAKVLSLAVANPGVAVPDLGYDDLTLRPGLPIVAVPTTAGTGAETNSFAVVTDESRTRKGYLGHPSLLPRATVLDPDLTFDLPPEATAATGVDALTHALESLLSRRPNPFAEAIALGVVRTVAEWLPRAFADGRDAEARSRMLMAAHLAGLGQASGTGVGTVHAIGHAIGALGRVAHGTALATVLPEVLRTYLGVRERELALAAVAMGVAAPSDEPGRSARAGIDGLDALLRSLGQRRTLRALGLSREREPFVVRAALDDPAILGSPRLPDESEVAEILAAVRG
jgi:alcohol dehydrogenase